MGKARTLSTKTGQGKLKALESVGMGAGWDVLLSGEGVALGRLEVDGRRVRGAVRVCGARVVVEVVGDGAAGPGDGDECFDQGGGGAVLDEGAVVQLPGDVTAA